MYKILLLSPPVFDFYFTPARSEPLGLLYIKKALLRVRNIKVDIYDSRLSRKQKQQAWPQEFEYLKKYYIPDRSPFSLFTRYYRFGDSFTKIVSVISKENYDIVAISSLFSGYHPDVEELTALIKQRTSSTVIIGGWGTTAVSQGNADFYIKGDGELILPNLISALKQKKNIYPIPGVLYSGRKHKTSKPGKPRPGPFSDDAKQYITQISETYPLRENSYYFKGRKIAKMILSKGCPYACRFCVIHKNSTFSIRSMESIDQELEYLTSIGTQIVNFEDDNLFHNKQFTKDFLDLLKKYKRQGMRFTAMNGITARNISDYVEDLIQSGFIELNMSLVSSDSMLQEKMGRPHGLSILEPVVTQVNGRVPVLIFLIAGLPGSNPKKLLQEINHLATLNVTIGFSPLYLIPGADLFKDMQLPCNQRMMRGSALYSFGDAFTREDIASIWKYVRMLNYLKTFPDKTTILNDQNFIFFKESLHRKQWLTKDEKGNWQDGFSFRCAFPEKLEICLYNGISFNLELQLNI